MEHAFLKRVRRLPQVSQQLLLVAATDESGELTTILDAAARLGVGADALDEVERAGLVRVRGMHVDLRHPLVRSAVYQGAPLSQRRAVHDALASALVGEARADRRAWHRAAASVEPDSAVVDELERAADRAHGPRRLRRGVARARARRRAERRRARARAAAHRAAENAWLRRPGPRALALLRAGARARPSSPRSAPTPIASSACIELTSGVPADSSQILFDAAQAIAPSDPGRALYLLSLASWGAAFARDGEAIGAIARAAEELEVADTPGTCFLRTRLAGLRAHFGGDFDVAAARFAPRSSSPMRRRTAASPTGSASSARSACSCATTARCSGCTAARPHAPATTAW